MISPTHSGVTTSNTQQEGDMGAYRIAVLSIFSSGLLPNRTPGFPWVWINPINLRWLNTVLPVSEYRSFAKLWQEKGCSSQAETWQVKNILMKDFDRQVKCDVFVVSMAT